MLAEGVRGEGSGALRICIATHELTGLTSANGLGTATANLARALAAAGHQVTVLFAGTLDGDADRAEAEYRSHGVELHLLPADLGGPTVGDAPVLKAWRVYAWVDEVHRSRAFDIVHVPDAFGIGALCATACRAGIGLTGARVVVGTHGPMSWIREGERFTNKVYEETVQEHLERTALRCADAVVSPSAFLLSYLERRGWQLPEARVVQQNCADLSLLRPAPAPGGPVAPAPADGPQDVAFFGRLVRLKGLELFCDALDELAAAGAGRPLTISFIGRSDHMSGVESTEYVAQRARRWPWPVAVHTDFDQAQALSYMAERRSLAVIASLIENSPNTVWEVMAAGIPFVAANAGGISELVHPDDRERVLFDLAPEPGPQPPPPRSEYAWRPRSQPLAAMLAAAVMAPPGPVRFAVDPADNVRRHVEVYAAIAGRPAAPPAAPGAAAADLVIDGRGLQGLPVWRGCAPQFASTTLVLEADQPDPADLDPAWRVVRSDRGGSGLWEALAACQAATVLVASGDVHPVNGLGLVAGSWLAALGASAALLPVAVMDGQAGRVVVPTAGVPVASLLGPHRAPGAVLLATEAARRHGPGPSLRAELAVHDLTTRMAMAGEWVALLPVIAGVRPETEADRGARGDDPLPARLTRAELTDLLVPYRAGLPPELQDLPGQLVELHAVLAGARAEAAGAWAAVRSLQAQLQAVTADRDRLAQGRPAAGGPLGSVAPVGAPLTLPGAGMAPVAAPPDGARLGLPR